METGHPLESESTAHHARTVLPVHPGSRPREHDPIASPSLASPHDYLPTSFAELPDPALPDVNQPFTALQAR